MRTRSDGSDVRRPPPRSALPCIALPVGRMVPGGRGRCEFVNWVRVRGLRKRKWRYVAAGRNACVVHTIATARRSDSELELFSLEIRNAQAGPCVQLKLALHTAIAAAPQQPQRWRSLVSHISNFSPRARTTLRARGRKGGRKARGKRGALRSTLTLDIPLGRSMNQ